MLQVFKASPWLEPGDTFWTVFYLFYQLLIMAEWNTCSSNWIWTLNLHRGVYQLYTLDYHSHINRKMYFLVPNSTSGTYNNLIIYYIKHNYVWNLRDRCSVSCLSIGPKLKYMLKLHVNIDGYNNEQDTNMLARKIGDLRLRNYHYQLIICTDIVYNKNLHIS